MKGLIQAKPNKMVGSSRTKRRLIFYILMMVLPLLQFAIFYIYANFNSILLAFQKTKMNLDGLGYTTYFAKLDNFKVAFRFLISESCLKMIVRSLILFACQIFIVTPLALVFSYYIAKGRTLSKFFRVVLYLPSVISAVVLAILYMYIVNEVYPIVAQKLTGATDVTGLLVNAQTANVKYVTVLFYTIWIGFGTNVMLYTGSMTNIDNSIIESAQLDGATNFQEFIHIYVPMTYPTITTFIITGVAAIFTEQMNLYTFFSTRGDVDVFGYYFYRITSLNLSNSGGGNMMTLRELSALGILASMIVIPLTLLVRHLMRKYGPSED